jgi:hypothetical protein
MTASTDGRNTKRRGRGVIVVPVAANTLVQVGLIACVNAAGYAVEGSTANNLIYLGCFDDTANNNAGAAGDMEVTVRTNEVFLFENSTTDPVTQANFGDVCFIEDNQTVAATDGGATRSKAGRVVGISNEGVWVE